MNVLRYRYRQTKSRDLIIRVETGYQESNSIDLTGPKFRYFTDSYTYTANYDEKNNPRYSLSGNIGGRQISFEKRFNVNATMEWSRLFEDLGGRMTAAPAGAAAAAAVQKPAAPGAKPDAQNPAVQKPETSPKPASQGLRRTVLLAVSKSLSPLTFRFANSRTLNYGGISDRPKFLVRIGQGSISPPDSNTVVSRQNTSNETETVSVNTSAKLPLDMGLSANSDLNRRTTSSLSANTRTQESTLPELDFKWSGLEKRLPFLMHYMSSIQFNSKFSLKALKEWLNDNDRPTTDKTTTSYSPLVSLNGILLNGIQTSVAYTLSTENNVTLSGITSSTIITDRRSLNADLRYSMSPSNVLLRKLNVKSTIDFQLAFTSSNDKQKRSIENKAMATTSRNSQWSVSPKADYRFSDKFTGSAMLRVQNSRDLTNKIHKIREVSISGRMVF
jgi:hypothetical protein